MISAAVITKDESEMIKACLESVRWADEIIIIDWEADDKTREIVKKYTDKVFKYSGNSFAEARNLAMEHAAGEWVLYVDTDERVLESLKAELIALALKSEKSAYAISRKNIIFGQPVDYGPYQKDWMIRYYKKADFRTWVGKVHEYGEFTGSLDYTKNSLLHLTHRDLDHVILKSLDWSNIDAKLRLDSNHPKMSSWRFLRILFGELFYQGIVRKGFFNGSVGVIDSCLQSFSLFMTYVRLWQIQQVKPLDEVYRDIDKKLIENNFNL